MAKVRPAGHFRAAKTNYLARMVVFSRRDSDLLYDNSTFHALFDRKLCPVGTKIVLKRPADKINCPLLVQNNGGQIVWSAGRIKKFFALWATNQLDQKVTILHQTQLLSIEKNYFANRTRSHSGQDLGCGVAIWPTLAQKLKTLMLLFKKLIKMERN